ncbi:MAG: lipopolysaccharide biosynthesis protein [Ignavibacteriales bacterium]|nr:lipopolysaccharide biosynthesis protein [Ignavibacteriales bacterium]
MSGVFNSVKSGIFYTFISKYSSIVVSIIIGSVLARLLSPSEFGVVAILTVFITFFSLLTNLGVSPAIVQNKSLTDEDISSIFSFTILVGLFFSIVFFLSAPFIASYYNEPVLIKLTRLMSSVIFIDSIQIVPYALNLKKLRFKQIAIISVSVHLIAGIIAIVLAYLGFSYYALILNSILSGVFMLAAYYYLEPVRTAFVIRLSSIRKIAKFSSYQFLFTFINYFAVNTDNLLIGKYFSASALGFYDKAYKLMLMPVQNLTFVITPVLHPVLAEYQDNKEVIYNAYVKIVKMLAIIGFPLSMFLYFNASEIITIMFGNQWGESIPVFKILALSIGIQIVLSSTGSIFQATNRTDLLFYSGLLSSILMIGGILYGIFVGKSLVSIGYGIILAISFNVFQAFYLLIKISLKRSLLEFLKIFTFPLMLTAGVGSTLWATTFINFNHFLISLSVKIILSILIFGLILFLSKENWTFVKEYVFKMMKK